MGLDRCVKNCFQNNVHTELSRKRHEDFISLAVPRQNLFEHPSISSRWRFCRGRVLQSRRPVPWASPRARLRLLKSFGRAVLRIRCNNVQVGPLQNVKCQTGDCHHLYDTLFREVHLSKPDQDRADNTDFHQGVCEITPEITVVHSTLNLNICKLFQGCLLSGHFLAGPRVSPLDSKLQLEF